MQLHDVFFMNARLPLPRALIADGTVVIRAALSSSKTPSTSTDSTALMLPLLTDQFLLQGTQNYTTTRRVKFETASTPNMDVDGDGQT